MKKLSYVKLHETWCLYFPFLFSSSVMQSFSSFPASSFLGTQQQLTDPLVKRSTLPLRKMPLFQGVAARHTILLNSASSLFGTQQQLTDPPVKSSNFPLLKNHVSQDLLFVNVLTLSWLGSLWFATHPYYSLHPYVDLYYPYYPCQFVLSAIRNILCVVYFYSERPLLSIIFYSMCRLFL